MIINNQESNIQVIGDITEFKSSIDPKNLEFITTLLSSNLYSAPERSFIREIVSNAWDSQVEANTTDIPIIIKIEEKTETIKTSYGSSYERWSGIGDITIRDFGTGLSPERFNEVYRNIGSSTKRESNAYHGAFGIGHLSGFSCSNTMYITSYYEGNCYEYIGIKDANTIVYTLVSTTPTTEKSGLEVTLKNVSLPKYRKALRYISFFPNVYLDDNNSGYDININEIQIKKHEDYWVASISMEDKLLLGNVLYPLNDNELNFSGCGLNGMETKELLEFIRNLQHTGLVFKFDIGELSVTPNRESIIYTKECNAKIIDKIIKVKKQVDKLIDDKSKEDFNDIKEYAEIIKEDRSFNFFTEKITPYNYKSYDLPKSIVSNLTYKGKSLSIYNNLINILLSDLLYYTKCYVNNSVYINLPWKHKNKCNLFKTSNILILTEDTKLSKYIKSYLIENYQGYIVLEPLTLNKVKDAVKLVARLDTYNDEDTINFIIQEVVDYIYSIGVKVDFNNDPDFLKYKEDCKEETKNRKKLNPIDTEEVIIYEYRSAYYKAHKRIFPNLKYAITALEGEHKGIVLIDRDTSDATKDAILSRKYLPIFAKKSVRDILKNCSFNVDLDWVLHKDPMLSYIKTIRELINDENALNNSLRVLTTVISPNYKDDIEKILKAHDLITNPTYGRFADAYGKIDESLKLNVLKLKCCISQYNKAAEILDDSGITTSYYNQTHNSSYIGLITKILVKQKSFMVNNTAYRYSKRNKLINVLCKK